jgi:hypothetical protein
VAILAIGLFASGIATMAFVHNALVVAQDQQLEARASSNLAAGLLDVEIDEDDGTVKISLTDQALAGDYFIAVYEPGGEALGGRPQEGGPIWPEEYTLEKTYSTGTTPFTLYGEDPDRSDRRDVLRRLHDPRAHHDRGRCTHHPPARHPDVPPARAGRACRDIHLVR